MVIEIVKDGETKYFHTAWVSSYDGNDFSLQNFDDAMYVGKLINDDQEEELDFHAYSWYLIVPGTSTSPEELARELEDIRSDFENSNSDIVGNMASVEEQTDEAKKVATDYIEDDGTTALFGSDFSNIIVGDSSSGHIEITPDGMSVKNGTVAIAFLGKGSNNSFLNFVDSNYITQYKKDGLSIIRRSDNNEVSLNNDVGLIAPIDSCFAVSSETLISSQNITAEGYTEGTKSISKSGYYPVAIAGWNSTTRYFALTRAYLSASSSGSGTISYMVSNHHSSAHSASMTVYVLWVKSA